MGRSSAKTSRSYRVRLLSFNLTARGAPTKSTTCHFTGELESRIMRRIVNHSANVECGAELANMCALSDSGCARPQCGTVTSYVCVTVETTSGESSKLGQIK